MPAVELGSGSAVGAGAGDVVVGVTHGQVGGACSHTAISQLIAPFHSIPPRSVSVPAVRRGVTDLLVPPAGVVRRFDLLDSTSITNCLSVVAMAAHDQWAHSRVIDSAKARTDQFVHLLYRRHSRRRDGESASSSQSGSTRALRAVQVQSA